MWLLFGLALPTLAWSQSMTNQHVSSGGVQANQGADNDDPAISDDDRWVVFASSASNLVTGDTNSDSDIFVHDNVTGATLLLSWDSSGGPSDGSNRRPSISATGRYVSWQSNATDLEPGVSGVHAYRHDRDTDGDGEFDEPGTTVTICVSRATDGTLGDGFSRTYTQSISDDGDRIVFESTSTNLVPSDTNGIEDAFVRIVSSGVTERLSVATGGAEADFGGRTPSISGNGLVAGFSSSATNLVVGDTNGGEDVFVRDLAAGTTVRASVSDSEDQANGGSRAQTLNDDGTLVAFSSAAFNLVDGDTNNRGDIFVRDLAAATTTRVSLSTSGDQANGASSAPVISGDGVFVAFESAATNLVPSDTNGDQDIFVRDRAIGATVRANRAVDGTQSNDLSADIGISSDGSHVAFRSFADTMVPGDTNAESDIFLRGEPFLGPGSGGGDPPVGWTDVILHPAGATESWAYATNGTEQGGFATYGTNHAGLWSGTPATWVDLNPGGASFSRVFAMAGTQQAGYASFPGPGTHAGVWSGTPASWFDLHPGAATESYAHGTTGTAQCGYAMVGGSFHASLWSGTSASWVDLHPAGPTESYAWGIAPGQQVGGAMIGGVFNASLWSGTAASWVNLNPAGAAYSLCYITTSVQQAGYASIGGAEHAGVWSGTAASWLDLNPPGAISSRAYSTTGTMQAGGADFGPGNHAGVWTGTATSWEDLHLLLPAAYTSSMARGIFDDGTGGLYVVGYAYNSALARDEAVFWTNVTTGPPPAAEDLPVTFSVNGPVDPHTEGIRYARGTPATPQVPVQPGNPIGACIRVGPVPQATGLPTPLPGDVSDYDAVAIPSEAVLFQSPPFPPAPPGPPPTPPDGTNNQILEPAAMGIASGPGLPTGLWTTVPPMAPPRDNVDAFSFGEDYFPPMITVGLAPDGLPPPPFGADGEIMVGVVPWAARGAVYSEPIVIDDAPGISFRFSSSPWDIGLPGTALAIESEGADVGAACGGAVPWTSPGDAAGDVFGTPVLMRVGGVTVGGGGNVLVHDNPTLALAPTAPPLDPMEDDLDALECVGENTSPWTFGGMPLRPGNLHARVIETGPPDPAPPGMSIHDVNNMAPVFFSLTRNSPSGPFTGARSQFVIDGGNSGDVLVAVKDSLDPAGVGINLLFTDESEIGLYATDASPGGTGAGDWSDDLDGMILWICPEYRATVILAIREILALEPPYMPGGYAPWSAYGFGDALVGGGMTVSITKYLDGTGRPIPPGCIRIGFSITTDSVGLLYTGVDWEAGPVAPPGGISAASGDVFYADIDGEAVNPNYEWYEEVALGQDAGAWVNGASSDLADLADNLNALDSINEAPGAAEVLEGNSPLPRLALGASFPNPFGPATTLTYALPRETRVKVLVYDLEGRQVATVVDEVQTAGRHLVTWDGRNDAGVRLATGVYFLRVVAGGETRSGKVVLLRD